MESMIGLHQTECVRRGPFHAGPLRTRADVEYTTATWIEWWNHARLQSTPGYRPGRAQSRSPRRDHHVPTGAATRIRAAPNQ